MHFSAGATKGSGSQDSTTDGRSRTGGIDGVSFEVEQGELFTLLGPSGCGKTTTLRSIAGLERPNSGSVRLRDQVLFDSESGINIPVNRRGISMVFQSYAIWPHMTVYKNVAFPFEVLPRKTRPTAKVIKDRVEQILETVGLLPYVNHSATQLSGGQQQRLALARALVTQPPVILLDEPLSNLDAKLRENMRMELKRLQRETGVTAIYVTHDQSEALSLSSRIAIMESGKIVQLGTPREIYDSPSSEYVADFLGGANFLEGMVTGYLGDEILVDTGIGVIHAAGQPKRGNGTRVVVCLRPEHMQVSTLVPAERPVNGFEGKLSATAFLGDRIDHVIRTGESELRIRSDASVRIRRADDVFIWVEPSDVIILDC
ncbi:MAG: ABC transporter ATP-binding protein [Acidimicrobiaceae bacterium]|nr:ABC transporter ATP-binding protein [Acidimicrobiaceae bacterium]